jgi:hypothetical protein
LSRNPGARPVNGPDSHRKEVHTLETLSPRSWNGAIISSLAHVSVIVDLVNSANQPLGNDTEFTVIGHRNLALCLLLQCPVDVRHPDSGK